MGSQITSRSSSLNGLSPKPPGFTIQHDGPELIIEYRHTGMGCFVLFLAVSLIFFTGISALCILNVPQDVVAMLITNWPAVFCALCGTVSYFYWTYLVFWLLFGVIIIHADTSRLTITKRLLGLQWERSFFSSELTEFRQAKDGGEGDDSFPSWSLRVIASGRSAFLIRRQPFEASSWLGSVLAQHYGVKFNSAPSHHE